MSNRGYDQYDQVSSPPPGSIRSLPTQQQQQGTFPPPQSQQGGVPVQHQRRPSNQNSFIQQTAPSQQPQFIPQQSQPQHNFGSNYNNPSLQSLQSSNNTHHQGQGQSGGQGRYEDDKHYNEFDFGSSVRSNSNDVGSMQSRGGNNNGGGGGWDNRNSHAHTSLIMEKDYGQVAYGAPSYPPSNSPLLHGNQFQNQQQQNYPQDPFQQNQNLNGIFGNLPRPNYYNENDQYSLMREKLLERRSLRAVELTDGHLVIEVPVPRSILQYNSYKGEDLSEESGRLRYTAVTDDPDDFTRQKYTLRSALQGRQTELFICMTMYNEDEELLCRTLTAVIKNIQHLQSRKKSKTWGDGSWKKVVVCIVSDGRSKINQRTLKIIGLYGAYQDGIAKDTIDGKDVQAHLFEYTTQVVVDSKGTVSGGIAPVQILFCLKEQNKKKLNSHRWAFNAFCPQLRPNVCVLLDVGTRPGGTSIYSLWKTFDRHSSVGGACGEITVDLGRGCGNLINPLVAAQNFEYKMSNILDKPLESVFGYISVLPGAFSAYRYKALLNGSDGRGPLQTYFLGEKMHEPGAVASLAESNLYLAEDRVLCFEIVAKRKEAWILKYVKSAKASTDVPNSVPEFISQRRRWINGSFFASVHSISAYYRIWTSGHNFFRKLWLSVITLYNLIQLIFQFIALSSFYLAFYFLCESAISDVGNDPFGGRGADVISVANSLYIATLGVTIVCALGNKPAGSKWWYISVMVVFAVLFGIALYCTVWTIYLSVPHTLAGWKDIKALFAQSGFRNIVISIAATYGLYIVSSILHLEPYHLLTSTFQYLFLLPSFVSVLSIYSFSNLQDLAWGTKGSTSIKDLGTATKKKTEDGKELVEVDIPTAPDDVDALWLHMRKEMTQPFVEVHKKRDADTKKADHYANIRTNTLLLYLGVNMIIVMFFTSSFWVNFQAAHSSAKPVINWYMIGIFWAVAALSAVRFLGSTLYLVLRFIGF